MPCSVKMIWPCASSSMQCQNRLPSSQWLFRKCFGENVESEGALITQVSGTGLHRRTGWQLWRNLGLAENVLSMLRDIQFSCHPVHC